MTSLPDGVFSVTDYEQQVANYLDANALAYLIGGSADEFTLAENTKAFSNIKLQSRVLADFSEADTECCLFGSQFSCPIFLAPVAWQQLFHHEGEQATVQAAAAMNMGMVLSTLSSTTLESVIADANNPLWFQLYIQHDRRFSAELVRRAEEAGYKAIVLTVDAPISGVRNREQRAKFHLPSHIVSANLQGMKEKPTSKTSLLDSPLFSGYLADAPTWQDVAWLRSITNLPILLKGVTWAQDAELALTMGIDGLIVSNHGGRTLDTLPATIDLLPDIITQVAGRVPVLLDGGVRRGTDILKALALGAKAVLIGRPYMYGLTVAGALGVAHVLSILRAELEAAMVFTGCRTLNEISSSVLWKRVPITKG